MRIHPGISVIVLLLAMFSSANALTWQEILDKAPLNSNDIKSAKKLLDAYQWTYYKSFSNFLPQISGNASSRQTTTSSSSTDSYSYGLSATQYLFKGMESYYGVWTAAINLDYYRSNFKKAEADYYYNARAAFVDLYIAQQLLEVEQQIKKSRADNNAMIKLLYDSGKEDKGNYMRSSAQLKDAENNIVAAKRQLELAQLKLTQLIELKADTANGDLQAGKVGLTDFDALLESTPDYIMAKKQLELADVNSKTTISEFLPNIYLQGSYTKSGSAWPPDSTSKSLSFGLSWSIFPGGANVADKLINDLMLGRAKEDFAKTKKDQIYSIKKAYDDLKNAIDAYGVSKIFFAAATERAKIAQAKYMNGLVAYYEWDQIQNEYINNQISVLNYLKSELVAEAAWYKSYGGYIK